MLLRYSAERVDYSVDAFSAWLRMTSVIVHNNRGHMRSVVMRRAQPIWALFHKRNLSVKCKCEVRGLVVFIATAFPMPIHTQLPWQRPIHAFCTYILHLHSFMK